MASHSETVTSIPDIPITIKVVFEGSNRKFKLPLADLSAAIFAERIRSILQIPENQAFVLERFSDSGNAYITLDQTNTSAYKQLYRAAKAKLKLRIRATLVNSEDKTTVQEQAKVQPFSSTTTQPLAAKLSYPYSMTSSGRPVEPVGTIGARDFSCVQARDQFFQQLASISREREMGRRMKEAPVQLPSSFWQIFCNNCDKPMADAHFHCSICDNGDYDLCEACVEAGKICPGEGHWLIKRFIQSGKVVTSATETVAPKSHGPIEQHRDTSGAFKADIKLECPSEPSRTCNSCVRVLPETALVTCNDCPDYDLCVACFKTEQGHHPGHSFGPTVATVTVADDIAGLCAPGRNIRHHAICDGCDEPVFGVRHKCMTCPDWDFCTKCVQNKRISHPGHRFVPIYDNLEVTSQAGHMHYGILCDGPLCQNKPGKAYIRGVRYKCAVCHDTDFCANCEAHPSTKHNETHPLLKFKTPVRGAHVTLVDEAPGRPRHVAGDATLNCPRVCARPASLRSVASTLPPYTPPTDVKTDKLTEVKSIASQTKAEENAISTKSITSNVSLEAHFVRDSIVDGTHLKAGSLFEQVWTLKNPGPQAWPVGSAVHFVGGDDMLIKNAGMLLNPSSGVTNATVRVVEAGQEHDFVVQLSTPQRVGKHISYWRLKTPDGHLFGHKLWCDVEVTAAEPKSSVLADYELQLYLLEQQNKKRVSAIKQMSSSLDSMSGSKTEYASAVETKASSITKENDTSATQSIMVFPTLDKESPTSSTLREPVNAPAVVDVTTAMPKSEDPISDATTETEAESAITNATGLEAGEHFEDLESVEYDVSESDDDGFLTDEEYDILDASDEEASQRGNKYL